MYVLPRDSHEPKCSFASMPAAMRGNRWEQCPVARIPKRCASEIMRALMSQRRNVRVLMCCAPKAWAKATALHQTANHCRTENHHSRCVVQEAVRLQCHPHTRREGP